MQPKIFKAAVAVFAFTLLVACGSKIESAMEGDAPAAMVEIENLEEIAPATDIQIAEGTSAEKVEIYSDKAKEAQTKLQLLLESNLLEIPEETSFLNKFIPTAFAEDSATTEEQVVELLAEIQVYTELAIEAATESTDPEEIVELLEEIQETQTETAEIIEEAVVEGNEEIEDVLTEAAEEVNESMGEIEDAVVEVEVAVASGEEEVSVEIETDVENFIFDGSQKINLRAMMNPVVRAEKKVKRLEKTAEKIEAKLTAGEISEEEAAEILAKVQNQIENSEKMQVLQTAFHEAKESGDEEAIGLAHEAIQEFNRSAATEKAEEFEAKILEKIESLPEEDQAEALEKYKEQKEQREEAVVRKQEALEKVEADRTMLREAKESGDEDAIEAAKETIEIHREEAKENLQERREVKSELQDVSREFKNVIQEVKKEIKLPVNQNLQQQNKLNSGN